MSIIFICGSLEAGKDGVGDYTYKLSSELAEMNITVAIIAINDVYVNKGSTEQGQFENVKIGIPYLRISATLGWRKKKELTLQFLNQQSCSWISLQFVPYAFNRKGIPFKLILFMRKIRKKVRLHILFHELWAGGKKNDSFKLQVTFHLQRFSIQRLLQYTEPDVVCTTNLLYQQLLSVMFPTRDIVLLPLFSNIIPTQHPLDNHVDQLLPEEITLHRSQYLIGILFGTYYHESWNIDSFIQDFVHYCHTVNKLPALLSIGNIGPGAMQWMEHTEKFQSQIVIRQLGFLKDTEVSSLMQLYGNFGILTTPVSIAGKSGAYMAYRAHGLTVVAQYPKLQGPDEPVHNEKNILFYYKDHFPNIPSERVKKISVNMISDIAYQFLSLLNENK